MLEFWQFLLAVKEQWRRVVTGSLVIGLLALAQDTHRLHAPGFVYWILICLTLFWAFFGAWREQYKNHQAATLYILSSEEKHVLHECNSLRDRFLELLRKFPTSPCVVNPFSMAWRPLVGTVDISFDVQQTIEWHTDCLDFLDELRGVTPENTFESFSLVLVARHRQLPAPSLECLRGLAEIQDSLLKKALR
jgi:hypothetical protein